eukprot:CAMPEP_0198218258 /NCGR_PEP_ID=MMETSP1445-20131203/68302_1 /TAXON_ID=36898 /ORGANISM="Pyramimonas sp., Strain CCMP2087" /LENGTH=53 /DNA_ID=CAMNT_0043895213 /DNA_START=139 /DNA_END=297 /DNA_ORIENTATION=-
MNERQHNGDSDESWSEMRPFVSDGNDGDSFSDTDTGPQNDWWSYFSARTDYSD